MKFETFSMKVMDPGENRFRDKCQRRSPGEQMHVRVGRKRRASGSKRGWKIAVNSG